MVYRYLIEYPHTGIEDRSPKDVFSSAKASDNDAISIFGINLSSLFVFIFLTIFAVLFLVLCASRSRHNDTNPAQGQTPTVQNTSGTNSVIPSSSGASIATPGTERTPSTSTVSEDEDPSSTHTDITQNNYEIPSIQPSPSTMAVPVPVFNNDNPSSSSVPDNSSSTVIIPASATPSVHPPSTIIPHTSMDNDHHDDNDKDTNSTRTVTKEEDPDIIVNIEPPITDSTVNNSNSTDTHFLPSPFPLPIPCPIPSTTVSTPMNDTLPIYIPPGDEHEHDHAEFMWPEKCHACYFSLRYGYRYIMCEGAHVFCFPCAVLAVRRYAKSLTRMNHYHNIHHNHASFRVLDNKCGIGDPPCPFVLIARTVSAIYRKCRIIDDVQTTIAANPIPPNSSILEIYEMLNGVIPLSPQEVPSSLRGIAPPPSSPLSVTSSSLPVHGNSGRTSVSSRRLQILQQNKLLASISPSCPVTSDIGVVGGTALSSTNSLSVIPTIASAPALSDDDLSITIEPAFEPSMVPSVLRTSTEFDIFLEDNGKHCPICQTKIPVQFLFHRPHHRYICRTCHTTLCYVCLVPIPVLNPEDDEEEEEKADDEKDTPYRINNGSNVPYKVGCPNNCPYACTSVKQTATSTIATTITTTTSTHPFVELAPTLSIASFDIICDCQDCPYCKPGISCPQCPFPLGCYGCALPEETETQYIERKKNRDRLQRQYQEHYPWNGPSNINMSRHSGREDRTNHEESSTDNMDSTELSKESVPQDSTSITVERTDNGIGLASATSSSAVEDTKDDGNEREMINTIEYPSLSSANMDTVPVHPTNSSNVDDTTVLPGPTRSQPAKLNPEDDDNI